MNKPAIVPFGEPPPDIQLLRVEALRREINTAKAELDNLSQDIDTHLSKTSLYRIEGRMSTMMSVILSMKIQAQR